MRYFNTIGPVRPEEHYCIPPLERMNRAEVLALVQGGLYFAIHAPRDSGKTSALLALRDLLNSGGIGAFRCAYISAEAARSAGEDVARAMGAIASEIAREARDTLGDNDTAGAANRFDATDLPYTALGTLLGDWARAEPTPLVLLIDDIDALIGDSLVSVLRQLRTGYVHRPDWFPDSVALCGVGDVRDYRMHTGSRREVTGGSVFNIKARSIRLEDFAPVQVTALLHQHTAATGQEFAPEAVEAVWEQTRGQPWLVNALAQEMCFSEGTLRAHDGPISAPDVLDAREQLILRRGPHLNRLAGELRTSRVTRVIHPLLTGDRSEFSALDLEYARDIGLVAPSPPLRVANPIYGELLSSAPTSTH